ncbi:reverse transcriptase domain-containing protein [Tanacetum coccineum]
MRTRSSLNLIVESSTTLKRRNRRRSKQRVEPFSLEETSVVTMADQRTMAELLQAPTEGYGDAIVIPAILAENFELKHGLLNLVTSKQFYGFEKEDPHAHIRWFNKITSTIKYKDVPNSSIKLMLFPFSIEGAARIWLEKEPPRSILTWEDLVSKFINQFFPPSKTTNLRNEITNFQQRFDESFCEAWDRFKDLLRACPHHGFTELHQLDTFYNALTPTNQDSLNATTGVPTVPTGSTKFLLVVHSSCWCKKTVKCVACLLGRWNGSRGTGVELETTLDVTEVEVGCPGKVGDGTKEEQDLYICVAEEDMSCTTSTPDIEVTYMTETEVREFNAKLEKKHVNQYNMVTSCSYDNLKKLYDELQKQFSDLDEQYNENYIQVQAYKSSFKTLEKQKKILLNNQLVFEEKIRVLSSELENTTNLLKYSEKVNADMSLEKQDLQAKLENERAINAKRTSSSKNFVKLIDSSMTVRTKIGLGCDEYIGENELGWDDSEFSVFTHTPEDVEGKPLYNRFVKTDRMKAVPPPLSGNYIPL